MCKSFTGPPERQGAQPRPVLSLADEGRETVCAHHPQLASEIQQPGWRLPSEWALSFGWCPPRRGSAFSSASALFPAGMALSVLGSLQNSPDYEDACCWAGETRHCLRELAALAADLGLIPARGGSQL